MLAEGHTHVHAVCVVGTDLPRCMALLELREEGRACADEDMIAALRAVRHAVSIPRRLWVLLPGPGCCSPNG